MTEPGAVRLRCAGNPYAVGEDIVAEVQLQDGAWTPLRGLCEAHVHVVARDFIRADLTMELASIDLSGLTPRVVQVYDQRSRWQRFWAWVVRA